MISFPRQYKKTEQGNILTMQVEVNEEDYTYYVKTGYLGFKLDYRKEECDSLEQACSEALSLHIEYKCKGYTSQDEV